MALGSAMADTLPIGYQVNDYTLQKVIGRGGFGVTYLAEDSFLRHQVALKEYFPLGIARRSGTAVVPLPVKEVEGLGDIFTWGRQRFLDEGRTLARFRHPNIVRVSRLFEDNNTAYLVMDFEEGRDLARHLDQMGRRPTEKDLLEMVIPLLDGLTLVHRAGYLHRDIKPGNILIRDDGSPVLLDFGAAREALGVRKKGFTVIVSPGFSPIEQYSSDTQQGPWTDIYALGAVLYWATVCEKLPDARMRGHSTAGQSAVRSARGKFSRSFLAAIDWAVEVEPSNRPQDLSAWRDALLGKDAGCVPAPVPTPSPTPAPVQRVPTGQWRRAMALIGGGKPGAVPGTADAATDEPGREPVGLPRAPVPARPVSYDLPPRVATDGDETVRDDELPGGPTLEITYNNRTHVCAATKINLTMGRSSECDIVFEDTIVSRRHALVSFRRDRFELTDTSKWGTYVQAGNEPAQKVTQGSMDLPSSGRIGVGKAPGVDDRLTMTFRLIAAPRRPG